MQPGEVIAEGESDDHAITRNSDDPARSTARASGLADLSREYQVRLGRIAVQDGQRALRYSLLDNAFRLECVLLRAAGRIFSEIAAAANADRAALTDTIRRTYRGDA